MKFRTKWIKISAFIISSIVIVGVLALRFHIPVVSRAVQYAVFPIQKPLVMVTHKIKNITQYFSEIEDLITQNATLTKENERLLYENAILLQYKEENENLKNILEMKQRYSEYAGIGANIIGKDPGNWYKVFTIDKGKTHTVKKDDVILANGGLVGHIKDANAIGSKVLAIIDDRSSVSAKVVRTGDIGIIKGDIELVNSGLCKLEIDIEAEIVKGDQIITSHLSDIYPPGIPIGVIEEVVIEKNGLVQYAYVKPVVDFKHLDKVLVLKTNMQSKIGEGQ